MKKHFLFFILALVSSPIFGQTLPPYLPGSGLLAWYPFNNNAHDESGNGHHAIPVGVVPSPDRMGHPNAAYHFDGIENNVTSIDSFFQINMSNYTISCWFNSDTVNNPHNYNNNQVIVNSSPHRCFAIGYNWGHSFKYSVYESSHPTSAWWDILTGNLTTVSKDSVSTKVWNHLVFMKMNDTGYRLYLNGVLDTHFHSTITPINYHCKISMGRTDTAIIPAETFWGYLDDFGYWTRQLSDSEITNVYFAITGDTTICAGGTGTLSTYVTGGLWSCSSSGVLTINPATGTFTGISPGVALINYSKDGLTAHFTVNVTPGSASDSIVATATICSGATTTATHLASSGAWSASNSYASVSTSGVVTGVLAGTDTINYTYSTPCGLINEMTIVTVNSFTPVAPILGDTIGCVPMEMPVYFTDATPGGIWSHTFGADSLTTTGVLYVNAPGTDTIRYSITGACGPVVSTHIIHILSVPVLDTIVGPSYLCIGNTALFANAYSGGTWNLSNASASVDTGGLVTAIFTGVDTISYLASNYCGSALTSKIITIYSPIECDSVLKIPTDVQVSGEIVLYPNPAGNTIYISNAGVGTKLWLINAVGQRILDCTLSDENFKVDISTLSAGSYLTVFFDNSGTTRFRTFVKK